MTCYELIYLSFNDAKKLNKQEHRERERKRVTWTKSIPWNILSNGSAYGLILKDLQSISPPKTTSTERK